MTLIPKVVLHPDFIPFNNISFFGEDKAIRFALSLFSLSLHARDVALCVPSIHFLFLCGSVRS